MRVSRFVGVQSERACTPIVSLQMRDVEWLNHAKMGERFSAILC